MVHLPWWGFPVTARDATLGSLRDWRDQTSFVGVSYPGMLSVVIVLSGIIGMHCLVGCASCPGGNQLGSTASQPTSLVDII